VNASILTFLRRHEVILFLVLTVVISWYPWWLEGTPHFRTWGPSLAGLIVIGLVGGRRGIGDALRRLWRWRVRFRWWMASFLVPIAIYLTALGVYVLAGGRPPAFTLIREEMHLLPVLTLILLLPIGGPGGEEPFGWRGYAQPVLQKKWGRWGPLLASLIIGAAWGVWHLPEFFNPASSQYALGFGFFVPFILMEVGWSVIMTWFYNKTGGSVLVAGVVFHLVIDVAAAALLADFSLRGMFRGEQMPPADTMLMWTFLGVTVVFAMGLIAATRGRLGYAQDG
jgi:membrane protease YdiL (CAAX protease family)